MTELKQFIRGKKFQENVQKDFEISSQDGFVKSEAVIKFEGLQKVKKRVGQISLLPNLTIL